MMTGFLYELLYMLPLSMLFVGIVQMELPSAGKGVASYICALVVLGICVLVKHGKNRLRFLAPLALIVAGSVALVVTPPEKWQSLLGSSQWILAAVGMAVLGFVIGWIMINSRPVRRTSFVLILAGLILVMASEGDYDLPKIGVDIALFLMLIIVADEVQHYWKKSGYTDIRGHMVTISPFIVGLVLIVFLLPAPKEAYDWKFVIQIYDRIGETIRMVDRMLDTSGDEYEGKVGFSEEGTLWGNLTHSDNVVMTLSGDERLGPALYLRGRTMDSFDGKNWTGSYSEKNRDNLLDTLETICAVDSYDPENEVDYLRRVKFQIRYEDFRTKYFFAPAKSAFSPNSIGDENYEQRGGNLVANKILDDELEYSVPYYRMNLSNEVFKKFLRQAKGANAKNWEEMMSRIDIQNIVLDWSDGTGKRNLGTSFDAYQRYKETINRRFLPETKLSDRVENILAEKTSEAKTSYDKLAAIESFLSGFEYTETPGKMPEYVNSPEAFLDYFILEQKKGYCNYFATAFVLMARAEGIPARFVQGFLVAEDWNDKVEVSSDMAHAWPEAYIDGIGWIPFEPTPGRDFKDSWSTIKETRDAHTGIKKNYALEQELEHEAEENREEPDSDVQNIDVMGKVIFALLILGAVVLFALIFLGVDRLITEISFRRMNEESRFRLICYRNFYVLRLLGFRLEQGETLEEFYNRASRNGIGGIDYIKQCELVAYASKSVDTSMLMEAVDNQLALMEYLKKDKGKLYLWYKYRVFRMRN